MICKRGMMSGGGKLIFRDLESSEVSHVEPMKNVVSIVALIRSSSKSSVVNYLRG